MQNLQSTKAIKVLKTGITILTRAIWVGKILHNIRLKIQCRRSAIPKAWELMFYIGCPSYTANIKKSNLVRRYVSFRKKVPIKASEENTHKNAGRDLKDSRVHF